MKIKEQVQTFNPFELHRNIDKHPRSWICIKGGGIKELVNEIELKIIKNNGLSRESISRILATRFGCSYGVFKYLLRGKSNFYPVPFVNAVVELCEDTTYLEKFKSKIECLKVNSASSKEVNVPRTLTQDLCKVVGAFMADGSLTVTYHAASKDEFELKSVAEILKSNNISYKYLNYKSRNEYQVRLTINDGNFNKVNDVIQHINKNINIQTHYDLELTDEHKSSVEAFRNWMFNVFKVLPNSVKKKTDKNAWRVSYYNKIVARFLMTFFNIIPGPKTYTAFEPNLIKNSCLENRKSFARGAIMFDGSFISAGKLCFSSKSKVFSESIKSILNEDEVCAGISLNRGSYSVYTYENTAKDKLLSYFEEQTYKWLRVKDFVDKSHQSIKELSSRYRIYPTNKITFKTLYSSIKDAQSCDLEYLSTQFNCAKSSLMPYLTVLTNRGLITVSLHPKTINMRCVNDSTQVLLKEDIHRLIFYKVKIRFGTYKNLGQRITICRGTLSAWKVRKNRMRLSILKRICDLCNIDFSVILKGVAETDRRIIEIV